MSDSDRRDDVAEAAAQPQKASGDAPADGPAPAAAAPVEEDGNPSRPPLSSAAPAQAAEEETPSDAVSVVVRLKPHLKRLPSAYMKHTAVAAAGGGARTLTIACPPPEGGAAEEEPCRYDFSSVVDPGEGDAEVCEAVTPRVAQAVAAGGGASVMCYGQTGSGKTHTVNALVPSIAAAVFEAADPDTDVVEVSYVQIYQSRAYNLLGAARDEGLGSPLPESCGGAACEPRYLVQTPAELVERVRLAQRLRCTSSHALNARSSQSHTVLALHLTRYVAGAPVSSARVAIADLAGSELRGAAAVAQLPAAPTLPDVTRALAAGGGEDLLAQYLAPRGPQWRLVFVVTASLEKANAAETRSALEVAAAVRRCAIPAAPEDGGPAARLCLAAPSFDDACAEYLYVTETLRVRVAAMPAEAEALRAGGARQQATLLEHRCAALRAALARREADVEELSSGAHREVVRAAYEGLRRQREAEREQALQLVEELLLAGGADARGGVAGTLMRLEQQLHAEREAGVAQRKALGGVARQSRRQAADLARLQEAVAEREAEQERLRGELRRATGRAEAAARQLTLAQRRLYLQHVEHAVREETQRVLAERPAAAAPDPGARQAHEELRALCEALQTRLTAMEAELDRSDRQRAELHEALADRTDTFRALWALLTPQQKARFTSGPADGAGRGRLSVPRASAAAAAETAGSLHTGHENVQLRATIRDLRRQLGDAAERARESALLVRELRGENDALRVRLQASEQRCGGLRAAEERFCAWREQMEVQLADSLTFLEAYEQRQHAMERQLRGLLADTDRLTAERDAALADADAARAALRDAHSGAPRGSADGWETLGPGGGEGPGAHRRTSTAQPQRLPHRAILRNMEDISLRLDRLQRAQSGVAASAAHRRAVRATQRRLPSARGPRRSHPKAG